jgi:Fe-S cluster assembly iron-binding protein IscA
MLTVTEKARTVIRTLVDRHDDLPDTAGLRMSGADDRPDQFTASVVAAPAPDDEVVDHDGVRVFLDAATSTALSDRRLDIQANDQGGIRLVLKAR